MKTYDYTDYIYLSFDMLLSLLEHYDVKYDDLRLIVGDEYINRLHRFIPFSTDEADEC